ncbi:hypothetical protein [Inquilinus sp. CA228]|uniref:hypothetical protein n=1 Tax=Inquilinus sp. CA228 TaxID=3455609 RepID=UPI003F8D12DD
MNSPIAGAVRGVVVAAVCLTLVTVPVRAAEPTPDNATWAYSFAYVMGATAGIIGACRFDDMRKAHDKAWESLQATFDAAHNMGIASIAKGGPEVLSGPQLAAALEVHGQILAYLAVGPCAGSKLIELNRLVVKIGSSMKAVSELSDASTLKFKISNLRNEGAEAEDQILRDTAREYNAILNGAAAEIVEKLKMIDLVNK